MTKKNTSVDIPLAKVVSAEEISNFRLDPYMLDLLWSEPFFSTVLRTVTKIKAEFIPTAGVAVVDNDIKLWWNPGFLAGLASKQVRGLLKHEAWHIILGHITKRRFEPHILWNYATDWAINSMIPDGELPAGGLKPGKAFEPLTEEQIERLTPEQVERFEKVSKFQENLPLEKAAEWYFAKLMDDKEIADAIEQGNKVNGKSLSKAIADGGVEFDENGNLVDKDGNPVHVIPGSTDDHDAWDELSDEEREIVQGKVKKALEDAIKAANDSASGWGSISAGQRKRIRDLVSNEVPWQAILKKFCGFTRRANRASNHKRLNRKYPAIHPGIQRGYTSSIAIYIDQSGSVSDSNLELLFAELRNLAKRTEFICYHFDAEVDEASETPWRKGKTPTTLRTRCGGTDFRAPTEHANKNASRFDGYLILTDGEAPDPGPSKLKRGWVIVPNRELGFQSSTRDFVIKMKKKESNN